MAERSSQRIPLNAVLGLIVVALAAGGAATWFTLRTTQPNPTPTTPVVESSSSPSPATLEENKILIYWLQANKDKIVLAPHTVAIDKAGSSQAEVLAAGIKRLLAGPANSDVTTTIPPDTKLNFLKIEQDGVHVDLSKAFTEGGGSTSMQGRVAQVLYTATSLKPNEKVWLSVDGEPLEVLGGEGLILEQPMTRQDFQENFSL
jgi:spore germination protein GerM